MIELAEMEKISVRRVAVTPNGARSLVCDHHIKVDDGAALAAGTEVKFTDPELGLIFSGRINDPTRKYQDGEGLSYVAADKYRLLQKTDARIACDYTTPAYSPGSSKFRIREKTTINDALALMVSRVIDKLPGGIVSSLGDTAKLFNSVDQGGEKIATGVDAILDQTEGGVAVMQYGPDALRVFDYYAQTPVTLKIGTYSVENRSATTPLFVGGQIKKTSNHKFKQVNVEGAGTFSRKYNVAITEVFIESVAGFGSTQIHRYRFYFPESNVLGTYFDKDEKCADGMFYKIQMGITDAGAPEDIDTGRVQFYALKRDTDVDFPLGSGTPNVNYGKWYTPFEFVTTPTAVIGTIAAAFDYTSFDGPFIYEKVSDDEALEDEGDFTIQKPSWVKFTSRGLQRVENTDPGTGAFTVHWEFADGTYTPVDGDEIIMLEHEENIDPSDEMADAATIYFKRHSDAVDGAGSLSVLIKDMTANIQIGTPITNFDNMRVSSFVIDVDGRQIIAEVSSQPLKANSNLAKELDARQRENYGNWRHKQRIEDLKCFPEVTLDSECQIVDPPRAAGVGT